MLLLTACDIRLPGAHGLVAAAPAEASKPRAASGAEADDRDADDQAAPAASADDGDTDDAGTDDPTTPEARGGDVERQASSGGAKADACTAARDHTATDVVDSRSELYAALADARPGDAIELRAGTTWRGLSRISGLHGTSERPIIITTDPSNPATIDGARSDANGVWIAGSEWVEVHNLRIRNVKYSGVVVGNGHGGGGRPVHHMVVRGVEISDTGQSGIQVNDESSHIDIRCNTVRDTGWYRPQYGEGVYLGMGSTTDDSSHDITVQGNHIHHTSSEAIDVKAPVYNVDITDNYVHHVDVASQGAITVGLNEVSYRDGGYRIERNVIHDVTSRRYDGAAIWVGHGNTLIANNVMWNLPDDEAITTSTDFANQSARTVRIFFNTIWNAPDGALAKNSTNSGGGAWNEAVHEVMNNIAPDDSMGAGNFVARDSDFLTTAGAALDAGDGPGSGLQLRTTATMADRATALSSVPIDITQQVRGTPPDPGAYEIVP